MVEAFMTIHMIFKLLIYPQIQIFSRSKGLKSRLKTWTKEGRRANHMEMCWIKTKREETWWNLSSLTIHHNKGSQQECSYQLRKKLFQDTRIKENQMEELFGKYRLRLSKTHLTSISLFHCKQKLNLEMYFMGLEINLEEFLNSTHTITSLRTKALDSTPNSTGRRKSIIHRKT